MQAWQLGFDFVDEALSGSVGLEADKIGRWRGGASLVGCRFALAAGKIEASEGD